MTTPFSYCSCVLAQQQMQEPKEHMYQQIYGWVWALGVWVVVHEQDSLFTFLNSPSILALSASPTRVMRDDERKKKYKCTAIRCDAPPVATPISHAPSTPDGDSARLATA
jgi:hypothetical protein